MLKNDKLLNIRINFNIYDSMYIGIIFLIGLIVTYNTYNNYFIIDDFIFLKEALITNDNFFHFFYIHQHFFRPVVNLTFFIFFKIFGLNPFGYFIFNIVFHLINSILVYWLTRILINNRKIAFIVGILFVINSVHADTIFWIAAFTGLEVAFLYLLSVISFIYFSNTRNNFYYWISLSSFAIGLLTKESIITLPFILTLLYFLYLRSKETSFIVFFRCIWPFYSLPVFLIAIHTWIQLSDGWIQRGEYGIGFHALSQIFIGFFMPLFSPKILYLFSPINADTLEGQELGLFLERFGLLEHQFLTLSLVFIICFLPFAAYFLWRLYKSNLQHIKFCIGFTIISLLPFSFFFGRAYPAFRYLYIPSIGSAILLGSILTLTFHKFSKSKYKIAIKGLVFIIFVSWSIANALTLIIEEKNYANYGSHTKALVNQLKNYKFPNNSTIFFINIPVEDLDIKAIIYLLFPGQKLKTKIIQKIPLIQAKKDIFILEYKNHNLLDIKIE